MMDYKEPTQRDLRNFGFLIGGVVCAVSLFVLYRHGSSAATMGGLVVGALFIVLGVEWPHVLGLPHRLWMKLAAKLLWVNTRIILTVLFTLVVVPMGLIARLLGRDLLGVALDADTPSYWQKRDGASGDHTVEQKRMERQF